MTPEPKYFAKLGIHKKHLSVTIACLQLSITHSKIDLETCSHEDRFAATGNRAPNIEPQRIIKIDAIRSPSKESSPPP